MKNQEKQKNSDLKFPMRLQVYLAKCGIASRRKCEKFISAGQVTVNGEVVTELGTKVLPSDKITFAGKPAKLETRKIYLLLNKPKGYLCASSDKFSRPLAVDLLKDFFDERLYNVGRLDFQSDGAIFFTNDGKFAQAVAHPSNEIEKEYNVETVSPFDEKILKSFCEGITINGILYQCINAKKLNNKKINITLVEGKNREIRNVLNHFNIKIKRLTRIRIGNVYLDKLDSGKFRHLTKMEVKDLMLNVEKLTK